MECLIGITFNNFVLVAADTKSGRSIITMKDDAEKIINLSNNMALAICGDSGDAVRFAEFIMQNVQLYKIRNGYEMRPEAAANFTRRNLAESLRSREPYNVNMLLAGIDKDCGPQLYFMDYLASLVRVPYAIHGYGSYMTLSVLDRNYRADMSLEEAIGLLTDCVKEIQKRFVMNLNCFKVRMVSKDGIENLADIGL